MEGEVCRGELGSGVSNCGTYEHFYICAGVRKRYGTAAVQNLAEFSFGPYEFDTFWLSEVAAGHRPALLCGFSASHLF